MRKRIKRKNKLFKKKLMSFCNSKSIQIKWNKKYFVILINRNPINRMMMMMMRVMRKQIMKKRMKRIWTKLIFKMMIKMKKMINLMKMNRMIYKMKSIYVN